MNTSPSYPNSVIAANIEKARQLRSVHLRELLLRLVRAAHLLLLGVVAPARRLRAR